MEVGRRGSYSLRAAVRVTTQVNPLILPSKIGRKHRIHCDLLDYSS